MRRYLVWSITFHALLLFVGAVIAPLRGLSGTYKPPIVIGVGLVDSGQLGRAGGGKPNLPKPAEDEKIAPRPDEKVETEKLKKVEKSKEPTKSKEAAKPKDTTKTPQLAQRDDTAGVGKIVTDGQGAGAGDGDIWGVESGAGANPYHRAGFAAIRANWRNPAMGRAVRTCVVKFTVKRNGQLTDIEVDKPSGNDLFDRAAVRAVQVTATWSAFPSDWEEDEQLIYLEFQYRP